MKPFLGKKNRIKIGCRVFGKFGPLIPNPNSKPGKKVAVYGVKQVELWLAQTLISTGMYLVMYIVLFTKFHVDVYVLLIVELVFLWMKIIQMM